VGENGSAKWNGFDSFYAEVVTKRGGFHSECERVEGTKAEVLGGIEGSLAEFLNALKTGDTPMGECHDNIKSFAMTIAAYESSLRGETVEIAELLS
jgi:predicted dehydrogenase